DGLGTTALPSQTITATGTVYRLASASAAAPAPIVFGNHHVGDSVTQTETLTNTAAADGFSEALDASIGATGGISASGSFAALGAQQTNGTALTVSLNTGTVGAKTGQATITLVSDGNNIDGLGTTAVGTQTVTATGTVYRLAAASAAAPAPIVFGNHHVGDSVTQTETLTNTAAADGFSEALDASIAPSGGISASGTISGLAAQATNSTALTVALNTATEGAKSGSADAPLTSDGSQHHGLGTTAIGTQTITATGTVYALAAAALSTGTIAFGATRVGAAAPTGTVSVSDGSVADPFQESVIYTAGTPSPSGGFALSGSDTGTVASGGSQALGFILNTATSGDFTGTTATVALTSTGAGTSGLGLTALTGATVTLDGKVYASAAAGLGSTSLNFGVVHVSDVANLSATVTNTTSGALTDVLIGGIGTVTGAAFQGSGSLGTGLAAGAS